MSFLDEALSDDLFLGGKLNMLQPQNGYRAATDPVFLAAAVPAKPGQTVLELGCGAGVALACLLARVPVQASGLEVQADYADLANRNMERNGLSAQITVGDLAKMPAVLRSQSYDHVMMNPPFYPSTSHSAPLDAGKTTAFLEGEVGLEGWITAGLKRLKPLGWITIIHRAERLPDILAGLAKAGDIRLLPLASRPGRAAGRVVVQARKGAAGPLRLLAPLLLHEGEKHTRDGDDFTEIASGILRGGKALVMDSR